MELEQITPLIRTYNEQPNIGRCLNRLRWAKRIIVIDSGSTDRTLTICQEFSNVKSIFYPFHSDAEPCNFGLQWVTSEWVLSLDADYILPKEFPEYVLALGNSKKVAGFRFPFRCWVLGMPLRRCLYPPRTILYQRVNAKYFNDGHTLRVRVLGHVQNVSMRIDHDDRKSLSRWFTSQHKYAVLEVEKLLSEDKMLRLPDQLRRMIWPAAPAVFLYTLFIKGLILDGWPGLFYVLQRTYAELLLSIYLLERRLPIMKYTPIGCEQTSFLRNLVRSAGD